MLKLLSMLKGLLAMKEYFGLSWSQERKRSQIWSELGVSIASEHKKRKLYKEIVKGKVRIDAMEINTQTKAGPSKQVKPMGFVPCARYSKIHI